MADGHDRPATRPAVGVLDDAAPDVSRRTFLRATAAAGGSAAVLGYGSTQEAEALAPVAIGVAAAAGAAGIGVGWALREWDPLGSDAPPEGLSASALHEDVYTTLRTRKSTNASTIVDNRNIIGTGLSDAMYIEGKLAAIEALNNEETQANVQAAAEDAIANYATTIELNLLKSWNEAANELQNLHDALVAHSNITSMDAMGFSWHGTTDPMDTSQGIKAGFGQLVDESVTLTDETTFTVKQIERDSSTASRYSPVTLFRDGATFDNTWFQGVNPEDGTEYAGLMEWQQWNGIWTDLQNTITTVNDGIVLWVDKVYSEVQAGSIEIADLVTPRERAAMMTDDEEYPQAVADLLALNIPVDLEREAVITIPSKSANLKGTFAVTDPSSTMEAGVTYTPSTFGSVFFTYDLSEGEGDWASYETGVDGGNVTFTAEPYEASRFLIDTDAGETATVRTGDFVDNGDGTWTVDVSDQLETDITNVSSVTAEADVDGTTYETINIVDDFTVESFTDSDGNDHATATFDQDDPQDDTNYITQDEWDDMQARNERLIEKYEEAVAASGGAAANGRWGVFQRLDIPLGPLGTIPGEATAGGITLGSIGAAIKAGVIGGGPPPGGA